MESMERLGCPRKIVSFVLPLGYTFNLDGSTLYLSMASIFIAQAAGVQLTVGQQIMMMLTLMLTSKGVAGVPRAALVILAGTVAQFGLPMEGVALVLGVDHLMDMGRTSVNVIGNCLATVVVSKWEGEFIEATDERSPWRQRRALIYHARPEATAAGAGPGRQHSISTSDAKSFATPS
jgi:proton glutamate symport protein